MKTFKNEKDIEHLIKVNKLFCDVDYIVNQKETKTSELVRSCLGNACAFSALKGKEFKITDDVMPISSILVTDIWNANNDVFTAEEIIKAEQTPHFKPINWMHRGSEDSQNENIGVMVEAQLIYGDFPEMNFMEDDQKDEIVSSNLNTVSGKVHIKQDGVIWAQYFPSYASKIRSGMAKENLYVSMECFFEDFGYCLRKDEDDESPIFLNRSNSNSSMSKDLIQYGGSGNTKYKGSKYQIGRWLKNIIFSGQGIVIEPANKRKGKILSVIINDTNKSKADIDPNFDPSSTNAPTGPTQESGALLNPNEVTSNPAGQTSLTTTPTDLAKLDDLPKTHEAPADGLLFYTAKEAAKVSEIELGCTGQHLYIQNRHGDNPLLYSKLLGDPSDLEDQMRVAQYRPCSDEQELRFVLQDMAKKGLKLRRAGRLSETLNTSQQPSVPGGSQDPTAPGSITIDPLTGLPGGQDNSTNPYPSQGSVLNDDLDDITNKVYDNFGDIKMSDITEEEVEKAVILATETIDRLNVENKEYEEAIVKATAHIEMLNAKIGEFEDFATNVESIADSAYSRKLGNNRSAEMNSLLGEDAGISDEDLASMDEKSYSTLKNSVSKIVSSVDKTTESIMQANAAAEAVSAAKKSRKSAMIVPSVKNDIVNPAESLIGFALGKRR